MFVYFEHIFMQRDRRSGLYRPVFVFTDEQHAIDLDAQVRTHERLEHACLVDNLGVANDLHDVPGLRSVLFMRLKRVSVHALVISDENLVRELRHLQGHVYGASKLAVRMKNSDLATE